AIALGAVEITMSDMVGGYTTLANHGENIKPRFVSRITDRNGVILHQSRAETKDVLSKDVAYAIVNLMEGVTESGSGARLRYTGKGNATYRVLTGYPYAFKNPIAGKTGTTQNNSDGWFIGMVPNLATGVWVGNEDRAAHFRTTAYGQGATTALPIWGLFMKKCYADETLSVSKDKFDRPQNTQIEIDCLKYVQAVDSLGNFIDENGNIIGDSLTTPKQSVIDEFDF